MTSAALTMITSGLGSGGSELQFCQLAIGLVDRGWEVNVISLQRGGRYRSLLAQHGIDVRECPVGRLTTPRAFLRLVSTIGSLPPAIIHTQAFRANLWGRLAGILQSQPIVASVRATYAYLPRSYYTIERAFSARTAKVIVPSRATAQHLVREVGIAADRVVVIPNGVDAEAFGPPREGLDFRNRWQLQGRFVILAPGRLVPQKNHALLIEAFVRFVRARPGATLVIAGAGPLEKHLKKQSAGTGSDAPVLFVGELDRASLASAMAAADVVALASNFEGMPNVLLEAMASARPVVATNVDGSGEVVTNGVDGFLVAPRSAQLFADALIYLADSPSVRLAFGAAGRRRVQADFTIDASTVAHIKVYQSVLSRPQATRTLSL